MIWHCVSQKSGMHGDKVFVLYDPSMIDVTNPEDFDNINPRAIIAYIQPDASGEIHSPVAVKGYGPFMYELAMSFSQNGIYPDRAGSSPSAKIIWDKFMSRVDVIKTPLESSLREDDNPDNPRNYRFSFNEKTIDVQTIVKNHEHINELRKSLGDSRFPHRLWEVAHHVFSKRIKTA